MRFGPLPPPAFISSTHLVRTTHPSELKQYNPRHENQHCSDDENYSNRDGCVPHEMTPVHRSPRKPLKNGWRTLPSADFARYSISANSSGSTQMPRCAIFLIGLRLPDKRLEASLQLLGRRGVKAVVDLSGVDQILTLAPAKV